MRHLVALAAALAVASAGCLSNTYRIPNNELNRLAQTAPEARGQRVRVVQQLGVDEGPPPAQPVTANTSVTVVVVGGVGGGHHHHRPPPPSPRGPSGGGGGGLRSTGGLAKSKSDAAWVAVVLAAVAVVGLAATEGARYDGWVAMHPMHPVHLYGPWGYTVLPLAHIDPGTASMTSRALVRPYEGPWGPLGRAPLDRAGFNYSLLGGGGLIPSADGTTELGPMFHIQFGYFPSHQVGIVADIGLNWRRNNFDNTVYDSRWGLELQYLPVEASIFHAGLFGGAGLGARIEDGVPREDRRKQGVVFGGGAMIQLALTTRLALTGRFGLGRAYNEATTSDITVGLSIY